MSGTVNTTLATSAMPIAALLKAISGRMAQAALIKAKAKKAARASAAGTSRACNRAAGRSQTATARTRQRPTVAEGQRPRAHERRGNGKHEQRAQHDAAATVGETMLRPVSSLENIPTSCHKRKRLKASGACAPRNGHGLSCGPLPAKQFERLAAGPRPDGFTCSK